MPASARPLAASAALVLTTVVFRDAGRVVYELAAFLPPGDEPARCRLLEAAYQVAAARGLPLAGCRHRFVCGSAAV